MQFPLEFGFVLLLGEESNLSDVESNFRLGLV
jgi:hypothetical protein